MFTSFKYKDKDVFFKEGMGGRIGPLLESGHFYEEGMLRFIETLDTPHAMLDVGAFVGTHTVFFGHFCDCSMVLAWEPNPKSYALLRENIEKNFPEHTPEIRTTQGCASNEITENTGTIDSVMSLTGEKVSLIKIDVEGDEFKVVEGAMETIKRDRPYLFIELWTDEERIKMDSILEPLGYERKQVFNATPTYFYAHSDSNYNL